jgi:hypothetical protein
VIVLGCWLLAGGNWRSTNADMLAGGLLILAIPRRPIHHSYGNWDRTLRW